MSEPLEDVRQEAIKAGLKVGEIHTTGDYPYTEKVGKNTFYFDPVPLAEISRQSATREHLCYYCGGMVSLTKKGETAFSVYDTDLFIPFHGQCLKDFKWKEDDNAD